MRRRQKYTRVTVPTAWFERAYLPRIDTRTGEQNHGDYAEVEAIRSSTFAVVPGGILFHAADLAFRKKVSGKIPLSGYSVRLARRRKIGTTVLASCLIAIVLSYGLKLTIGVLPGDLLGGIIATGFVGLIVGASFFFITPDTGVTFHLSKDQQAVTLNKVHPNFAMATEALLDRQRASVTFQSSVGGGLRH